MLSDMKIIFVILLLSLCAYSVFATTNYLDLRDDCASGYTLCAPAGATTTQVPKIGDPTLQNLYVDLVKSPLPDGNNDAAPVAEGSPSLNLRTSSASLCCVATLTCLTMSSLFIPFCYDRFTTNFFLPDGSYGTIVGGLYTSSTGDKVNLISGDCTLKDGMVANIYSGNEGAKPNTATLSLPSQFTSQGVGTAIPASALGAVVTITYTTVLAGTTVEPSIVTATTKQEQVISQTEIPATTITTSIPGSTLISIVPEVTFTTTSSDSTIFSIAQGKTFTTIVPGSIVVSNVPETTIPLTTIPQTTILATTVSGTTVLPSTALLTTTILATAVNSAEESSGVSESGTVTGTGSRAGSPPGTAAAAASTSSRSVASSLGGVPSGCGLLLMSVAVSIAGFWL